MSVNTLMLKWTSVQTMQESKFLQITRLSCMAMGSKQSELSNTDADLPWNSLAIILDFVKDVVDTLIFLKNNRKLGSCSQYWNWTWKKNDKGGRILYILQLIKLIWTDRFR